MSRQRNENGTFAVEHGDKPSDGPPAPEYLSWREMRARCNRASHPNYDNYGGRGIRVCRRWQDSYPNFLKDMGRKPEGTSLDRKDNEGNYTPANCRWATRQQQNNNRRNNHLLTYDGQTMTITQWERHLGFPDKTVSQRLNVLGWTVEDSLTKPVRNLPKRT